MRTKMVLSFLAFVAIGLTGCRPEFQDTGCEQDSDCFSDEYCAPARLCVLRTISSLNIDKFRPSSPIVTQGEGVTLSWETRGGKSARIDGPDDFSYEIPSASIAEGELEIASLDTAGVQTYTLTLTWDDLEVSESLEVEVEESEVITPVIDRFESDVDTIDPGARVTLSWNLTDATSAVITGGSAPFEIPEAQLGSGSVDVNPEETTTYVLTATNGSESVDATRIITVIPPSEPSITSFVASATSIVVGESLTLSWEVEDGTSLSIIDGESNEVFGSQDLDVIAQDSVMVSPTQSTSYTLNVLNDVGSVQSMPIEVTVTVAPVINAFFASETMNVAPGSMVNLNWDVAGADDIEIRDQDDALVTSSTMPTGSFAVTIDENKSYTLTASNAAGTVTSTPVDVTVIGAAVINSFTASKQDGVLFDEVIDLSWDVTGADGIELRDQNDALITSSMMATGTFSVNITANTTFTLIASNGAGDVTSSLDVTLLAPPSINSFLASQTTNVTPGSMIDLSWDVTGADGIEIRDQDSTLITSSMMATGTFSATIPATTTFTLTASNGAGSVSAVVTVDALTPPTITSFVADTTSTISGEAVMLSWVTQDTITLTITNDRDASTIDVMAADIASGMVQLRPQVTTTYTLTASSTGAGNSVTQDVTITVSAAPLLITEVLFAPAGGILAQQWVEIYNSGTTFVDLQHYSLGWGGSSLAEHTKALVPYLIAPGETYVIGAMSASNNFSPAIDLSSGFSPALGNGAAAADGVALFFARAQDLTAASVPLDSVLWGGANTNMLLGEGGVADTEISPAPTGTSIVRVSATSDLFVDSGLGHPNLPIFANAIVPTSGPRTATDTFVIQGYGFDPMLDTYVLGTTPVTCTGDSEQLVCQLDLTTPSSDLGLVEFRASRTQKYVPDAQGEPMLAPATPVRTHVQQDSFFFEAFEPDPGGSFNCETLTPVPSMTTAGSPISVTMSLFAMGSTEGAAGMLPAGWVVQAAIFDPAVAPFNTFAPQWQTWMAGVDMQMDDAVNSDNELFTLDLTSPVARSAQATFRVSRDMGTSWIYCNAESAGGSGAGWIQGVDVTWN